MEGQQLRNACDQSELNLIDVLRIFWKQKFLIGSMTTVAVLLGLAYIHFTKPVYEATAFISAPSTGDIAPLNVGRSKAKNAILPVYSIEEVYDMFTKVLQAESTKRLFFKEVVLPSLQNNNESVAEGKRYAQFSPSLTIKEIRAIPSPSNSPPPNFIVALKGPSPEQDAKWLKQYIELAQQKATEDMLVNFNRQRSTVISDLNGKIESIREVANNQRLDRIQQLQEAIKVAQAIGTQGGNSGKIIADASVVNDPSMMYLRGSTALKAELESLSRRESSDAFAPAELKLRETQSRLDFYKKISLNPDTILMFKLDGNIQTPDMPIAPRKKIILLFALIAGLFLGTTLALTRKALSLIVK